MNTTCTVCGHDLWHTEQGHQACGACIRRLDRMLQDLAGPHGLYAQLATVLQPGTLADNARVSGSRTAPLPIRLEPLSLSSRGGVVTILQTWLVDIHDHLGYRHPRWQGGLQGQLDQAVSRLRILLPWAAENHPAIAELFAEVRQAVGQCRAQDLRRTPRQTRHRRLHPLRRHHAHHPRHPRTTLPVRNPVRVGRTPAAQPR
ncbi:hypothetical protein [Streptomyces reniochalinae]